MRRTTHYSADDARREIAEAIERADVLGQAIAAQLAEAERELEAIRRGEVRIASGSALVAGSTRS
jgi:hypothetical protein